MQQMKKILKKVVKELKDINNLVEHYIEMDENSEYRSKLFILLMLLSIFCMNTLKNEQVILIGENSLKLLSILCNLKILFFLM